MRRTLFWLISLGCGPLFANDSDFECFQLRIEEPIPRHQDKGAIERLVAKTLLDEIKRRECQPGSIFQMSLDPSLNVEEGHQGRGRNSKLAAVFCCYAQSPQGEQWQDPYHSYASY